MSMKRFSRYIQSIPIDQGDWDGYLQQQGNQRLYHIVGGLGEQYWLNNIPDYPQEMLEFLAILEDIQKVNGLLPASDEIRTVEYGNLSSRDGFAYLATGWALSKLIPRDDGESLAPIYVNSIDLDPKLIYPDEDHVLNNMQIAVEMYGDGKDEINPFYRKYMEDPEYGYFGNVAEFVEKMNQGGHDVDNTMALHSIDRGGLLAYKGGVPASIIHPNEEFWRVVVQQYDERLKGERIDYRRIQVDGLSLRDPQWESWLFQTEQILAKCAELSDPESSGEFQAMVDDTSRVYEVMGIRQ